MTAALDEIRAEIDALDADLRARLLRRAELVAQIGAACGIQGIGPGRFRAVPGALLRDSGGPRGVVLGSLGGPEIIVLQQ